MILQLCEEDGTIILVNLEALLLYSFPNGLNKGSPDCKNAPAALSSTGFG